MTSASGGSNNRQKRKIWDESPNTFTEFGPLSSEMKPSGGFFSRLWKRNKDDSSQPGTAIDENPVVETLTHSPSDSDISISAASGSRGATPPPFIGTMPRQGPRSSITSDTDTVSRLSASDKNDQSEEVLETQVISSRVSHRTLSSVLNRLGSILDHRSATPQTYKDSDFKQYWMPDSSCRECYDCSDKFTTFRRRHHCRICGQIFCSKCCNQELPGKIIGYKGGIRVCTYCCRVVQRYAQQSASTGDYKALEELRAISQSCNDFDFGRRSVSPKLSLGMDDLNAQIRGDSIPDLPGVIPSDLNTPFDLTPQSEFSSQDSLLLENKLLIQDSLQLRELWRQVCDMEAGVEIQTIRIRLRTHQNCIVGKELVDWLIKRDKATTRDQAMAIGQALLYAGYLETVGHQSMFKDDFTLYRPGETALALDILGEPETMPTITEEMEKNEPLWFQEIGRTGDDDEVDGHQLTHSTPSDDPNLTMMDSEGHKSYSSESDTRTLFNNHQTSRSGSFSEMPKPMTLMSRDILDEPLPRQDSSVHGLGDEFLKGALFLRNPPVPSSDVVACPHGWRSVDQLREENGEKLAYERLKRAHTGLWHALTRQMLSEQCLLLSWEMVIYTCITQISHFVRPDVRMEGDDMDIRNYVHIKKVSGGNKSDTSLFHGVVFTKNIAHKKMKTKIANPLILLLRGTIEFQRVENKFSSLEPQILQEREFMRNCVMKMIAYRPNVVVVEKSVSRLAQEYLLEAGITLLYNVKPSVMERLARFTQADIVPSIDGLVSKPNMGFCHDFRLQTFTLANKETKTLAVFDGCATHLGCTIVLRGGSPSELRRVKHILKFMAYTAYNSLLELCFCMDEFAMPLPGADELEQPFDGLDSSTDQSFHDGSGSARKEGSSFDEKSLMEKKEEEEEQEEETNERSRIIDCHIGTDSDQHLEIMEYQSKSDMFSFIDKDVDALSMDYKGEHKSTISSVQSSSSDLADVEGGFEFQGREMSYCIQSENERFRRDIWYDSPSNYMLDHDSEQETDLTRRVPNESMVSSSDVKNSSEERSKSTSDQNRQEIALPCEDHFYEDDDTAGIYAVTTAATLPIHHDVVTTIADMTTTSVAMESISTGTFSEQKINSVQREKIRHLSGVSVVDTMSGRSTPDYILKGDAPVKTAWDGSPKLIGNIMCIIPKSSLPIIVGGPPPVDTENCIESDSIDNNNINVASSINEPQGKDFTQVCTNEDVFISSDPKVDVDCETQIVDLHAGDSLLNSSSKPQVDENSVVNLRKTERSGSVCSHPRPSTSILTELTDFSDPLLGYQNTQDESIFNSANTMKIALKEIKQTNYKRFRKALDGVHLSVSPYHKYSVPFIETDKGSRCSVRKYLPDEIFWSRLFDGEESQWQTKSKAADVEVSAKSATKNSIQILDAHSLITCKLTEPVWDNNTQTMLADFRARGGRIQLTTENGKQPQNDASGKKGDDSQGMEYASSGLMWEKKIDCLDPTNHQKLMVLFSNYSYKSANHPYPCVYPWVVTMDFYGRNDITLGGFLERFCFRKQYSCPSPTCDTPMTDHVRRFVHGSYCINVLLKKLDNEVPGGKENILMWSWCRKCKQVTPVVPISGDTWNLSFAKYLDLRFHSSSFLRRGSAEPCSHSLHHDHFQYFGHRNIVASFKLAIICLKEVALPATTVSLEPATFDAVALSETLKNITYKATDRYSLMLENTMKFKQELTADTYIRAISEILTEQQHDKKSFRDSATNTQMKINELIHSVTNVASIGQTDCDMTFHLYAIFDNIELLKRKICEDVSNWNTRMQEFMLLQQKKPRTQVSNKKDKDIGQPTVEELEKSGKGGSDRSSKASIPPSPASLSASGPYPQQPPPSPTMLKAHLSALMQTSVVNKTSEDSSDLSSAVNGNNPSIETTPNNSTTTMTSSTVSNNTVPELHVTDSSSSSTTGPVSAAAVSKDLMTPALEGLEDTTDGWFQDLKGATRRWLSTSSFIPLPLPFEPCEHHTLPMCEKVPVAVYDHEPSSIIAYALSSSDYLCRLREIQNATRANSSELTTGSSQPSKPTSKPDPVSIISATTEAFVESGRKAGGGVLSFLRGSGGSRDPSPQHNPHSAHHKMEAAVRYVPGSEWGDTGGIQEDVDMSLLSDEATPSPEEKPKVGSAAPSPHIELQFSDSAAKFYCRVYFADQFRKLRKLIFPGSDNIFIRSLSRCKSWEAKGGKSGSSFSKTVDDRFILKQMSSMEVESFEKFGPQYFQYIKLCVSEQQPTALAKIMGVFRIGFRNTQTNHALRQDVLVMENLFYNRKISQKFDLKGSMRNRLVNTASKRAEDELVLLDENLLKCSVENPLYLRPHSKHVLKSAITSDSAFLSTNLVMDYSLLVGVDEDTQELVVGIIDYIRTFTWDKRLEMVVKSSGILGGQGKMPTVVSPQLYRGRFLEAMDRYFLHVPDHWMGLGKDFPSHQYKVDS